MTLELGGKSPQIVFADADLDAALPVLVNADRAERRARPARPAARLLVERPVYDAVLERLAERFSALRVGPALRRPRRRAADLGAPAASA